jgi:hypothetical protein
VAPVSLAEAKVRGTKANCEFILSTFGFPISIQVRCGGLE